MFWSGGPGPAAGRGVAKWRGRISRRARQSKATQTRIQVAGNTATVTCTQSNAIMEAPALPCTDIRTLASPAAPLTFLETDSVFILFLNFLNVFELFLQFL